MNKPKVSKVPDYRSVPMLHAYLAKDKKYHPQFKLTANPLSYAKYLVANRGYESVEGVLIGDAIRRLFVSDELWATATSEYGIDTCKAMAKANNDCPGCVFADPTTAGYLVRLAVTASLGNIPAVNMLQKICVPKLAREGRRKLTGEVVRFLPALYADCVRVRQVYDHLYQRIHDKDGSIQQLKIVFPGVKNLDGKYLQLACGYATKNGRDILVDPMVASCTIFGMATGYDERSIRTAIKPFRDDGLFARHRRKGIELANLVIKDIDLKFAKEKVSAIKAAKMAKAGNPPKKSSKPSSKAVFRKR